MFPISINIYKLPFSFDKCASSMQSYVCRLGHTCCRYRASLRNAASCVDVDVMATGNTSYRNNTRHSCQYYRVISREFSCDTYIPKLTWNLYHKLDNGQQGFLNFPGIHVHVVTLLFQFQKLRHSFYRLKPALNFDLLRLSHFCHLQRSRPLLHDLERSWPVLALCSPLQRDKNCSFTLLLVLWADNRINEKIKLHLLLNFFSKEFLLFK